MSEVNLEIQKLSDFVSLINSLRCLVEGNYHLGGFPHLDIIQIQNPAIVAYRNNELRTMYREFINKHYEHICDVWSLINKTKLQDNIASFEKEIPYFFFYKQSQMLYEHVGVANDGTIIAKSTPIIPVYAIPLIPSRNFEMFNDKHWRISVAVVLPMIEGIKFDQPFCYVMHNETDESILYTRFINDPMCPTNK